MVEFPRATIAQGTGNSKDSAILACSLFRNHTDCYVIVGGYRGYGHAWVQTDSDILETIWSFGHFVSNVQNLHAYAMLND